MLETNNAANVPRLSTRLVGFTSKGFCNLLSADVPERPSLSFMVVKING